MTPQPPPPGTTLIVRGGRVILPNGDWHAPGTADIAIAGDTIAGIAEHFERTSGAPIIGHGARPRRR